MPLQGPAWGFCPPGPQPMPPSYPGRPRHPPGVGLLRGGPSCPGLCPHRPQGKRRAGAGGRLSEWGLSCVVPGLWLPPAPTLSLGTLSTPHGGRDQCVPGCPQPWLPWGTQPRGPAHRCPCSCSHCLRDCPHFHTGGSVSHVAAEPSHGASPAAALAEGCGRWRAVHGTNLVT